MEVQVRPEVGTPYGRYVAAQVGFSLQRLVHLDELWTAELRTAPGDALSNDTVDGLRRLVAEMERSLDEAPEQVRELRMMLDEAGAEAVDRAFRSIREAEEAPRALDVLPLELEDYELRSAAIAGCEYIEARADDEAMLLRKKLAEIVASGEIPPGDLLAPFRCAALVALVGAGTISVIGLGGPVGFVAMGAVSQAGLGALCWVQEKCGAQVKAITFGRRG